MMAQCPEAQDRLAEELTCSICLCTYQEPVSLNCGHSFCRTCILQAFGSQKDLARVYSCPVCQAKYDQIPELQKNFQLCNIVQTLSDLHEKESTDPVIPCSYCLGEPDPAVKTCLNCEVSLCQQHLEKHYNKSHVMLEPTESLLERKCSEHGKLIEYYCEDDCSCVCVACYVVGFHKGHTLMTLNAARTKVMATFSQRISSLQGSKDDLSKDIQELEKGLETLQKNESKLSIPISDLSDNICSQVKKQCQVVLNAIITYKTIKTWEIEALTKEMHRKREEALAALAKLETLRGQSEDLLFLKDFQACQERLSALNFKMDTLQVFDVAVDKEVMERIEDETASYISEINCILRGVHRIISVQAKQLVWKNGSRITVEPKLDKGVFLENPVQLDMKFEDVRLEALTLSNDGKTVTARRTATYDLCVYTNTYIRKNGLMMVFFWLVDVSKAVDWKVGFADHISSFSNIRKWYLSYANQCLSYVSANPVLLGKLFVKTLKVQLDLGKRLLGFYSTTESGKDSPLLICRCEEAFNSDLYPAFSMKGGSLSLL